MTTRKVTVLVVEDDKRVLKLAERYLNDLGYQVLLAEHGQGAIDLLQSNSAIEIVFSDINMPGGISGIDLRHWVIEQRSTVKVLLTTGLASEPKDESPLPTFLRKPYNKEQLAKAMQDVMTFGH